MAADEQIGKGSPGGAAIPFPISFGAGSTPVAQQSGAAQGVVTPASTTVATTAATTGSPVGYTTTTQANAITAQLNAAVADIASVTTLVNSIRAALVAHNLIKGGA